MFEYKAQNSVQMKKISTSTLPNFHGLIGEDPDTFLFEFHVLCCSYDYSTYAQKLKLFLTTLKDTALRRFMGGLLGILSRLWKIWNKPSGKSTKTIVKPGICQDTFWKCPKKMKKVLKRTLKDSNFIFGDLEKINWTLTHSDLCFLKVSGRNDWDVLNLMGVGYIYKLPYEEICELCMWYSQGNIKQGRGPRGRWTQNMKISGGVTRTDIGKLFVRWFENWHPCWKLRQFTKGQVMK